MDTTDATALLGPLLNASGIAPDPIREPIRVWARSGVERLRLAGGGSVVFKYEDEPFDREHLTLTLKDTIKHLFQLRFQSATERLETPSEIRKAKKEIARIKTIIRERELKKAAHNGSR